MAPPSVNNNVSWYVATSWGSIRGFSEDEAKEALADLPEVKKRFDVIRAELADPNSIAARLFKLLPNKKQKVKIFLHAPTYKSNSNAHVLDESIPLLGGIHVYSEQFSLQNPTKHPIPEIFLKADELSCMRSFVHELWHIIVGRKKPETDLGRIIEGLHPGPWRDDSLKEDAFEEIVGTILAEAALINAFKRDKITFEKFKVTKTGISYVLTHFDKNSSLSLGLEEGFRNTDSDTIHLNYACLSAFLVDPKLKLGNLVSTILRNGVKMSLEEFLSYFAEEYPEEAKRLMQSGKCM